ATAVRDSGPRSRVPGRRVGGLAPRVFGSATDAPAQDGAGLRGVAEHALPIRNELPSRRAEAPRRRRARRDGGHRRDPDVLLLHENRRHAPARGGHGRHRTRRPRPRSGPLANQALVGIVAGPAMRPTQSIRAVLSNGLARTAMPARSDEGSDVSPYPETIRTGSSAQRGIA